MGQVIFFKKKPTSTNFTRSILEYFVPFDVISPSQAWPYLQWCSMFSEHPKKNKKLLSEGDRESQWPEISYNSSEITYGKMLSL